MAQSSYTLACIERAVDFITEQVGSGREPVLADIAKACGLSKYHFHRAYRLALQSS
ncbi:MAG: hypothetical protein HRU11_12715 [Parvularculaceae bacterium]|nr:hypothetical protein [Parvularculaceae bacterium]